jgi:hypothetical protein
MAYRLLGTPPTPYNLRLLKEQATASLDGFRAASAVHAGEGPPLERILFKFADGATTTQDDVDTLLAAHDGEALSAGERRQIARESGEQVFSALPGWATWTAQETEDYIDTNVTDLASAKVVLKALAKAIVALRNARWPGLQG